MASTSASERPELTGGPEPSRTLVEAVEGSIEAEIANPDLSAKLLCTRLGVSP